VHFQELKYLWTGKVVDSFQLREVEQQRLLTGKRYLEFLRVPALSAGLYVLPPGGTDPQAPHKQDELYYVIRGRARMRIGSEEQEVSAGSIIFVAAEVEHRFYEIKEELAVLVFFAPAESA
jgi:mannose-6-phosphate isomerase-like protein (cupin superfamily)